MSNMRNVYLIRPTIINMISLAKYCDIFKFKSIAKQFRPKFCPHCGHNKLWPHGTYDRKADRSNSAEPTLNPIKISRYICCKCHRTCSQLPECIPPRRWYLWSIQQTAILLVLMGKLFVRQAWNQVSVAARLVDGFNGSPLISLSPLLFILNLSCPG